METKSRYSEAEAHFLEVMGEELKAAYLASNGNGSTELTPHQRKCCDYYLNILEIFLKQKISFYVPRRDRPAGYEEDGSIGMLIRCSPEKWKRVVARFMCNMEVGTDEERDSEGELKNKKVVDFGKLLQKAILETKTRMSKELDAKEPKEKFLPKPTRGAIIRAWRTRGSRRLRQ